MVGGEHQSVKAKVKMPLDSNQQLLKMLNTKRARGGVWSLISHARTG